MVEERQRVVRTARTSARQRADAVLGLRERKKRATRELIEQMALGLFERQGYDATTLAQVAEAADVSPRTIFSYFSSKEDIVFAHEPAFLARLEAALESRSPATTTAESLREFLTSTADVDRRARSRERVIAASEALRGRERARSVHLERILAASIQRDLHTPPNDLRPFMVAAAATAAFAAARNRRLSGRKRPLTHAETLEVLDLGLHMMETLMDAVSET